MDVGGKIAEIAEGRPDGGIVLNYERPEFSSSKNRQKI
jgi:hypothetical protein